MKYPLRDRCERLLTQKRSYTKNICHATDVKRACFSKVISGRIFAPLMKTFKRLLIRLLRLLDEPGGYIRVTFFDFSSAFNTIRPVWGWINPLSLGIIDYLTWTYVRELCLRDCRSTGAPKGTVLAQFLFTLYTTDINHNSWVLPLSEILTIQQ